MQHPTLAIIGGGNMARAIVEGACRAGVLAAGEILVAEPDESKRAHFAALGAAVFRSARSMLGALGPATAVMLAVKPQSLAAVASELAPLTPRVVITILAGTPSARVREMLGAGCRVVRAMPNTPAQIGQGCTAVALGAGANPGDESLALRLFRGVGPLVETIDESLMDAFTAVAGSGPAYVFYLAEAMARAACTLGFEPAVADRVVRQVIAGSGGLLAAEAMRSPASLRAAVTSKGGTTEAACRVLDEGAASELFERAIRAARDRGAELANNLA